MKWMALPALLALSTPAGAVPAPPWMLEPDARPLLDAAVAAHAAAEPLGLDAPNPLYGPDNPAFDVAAPACGDAQMKVLVLLVDFSDNAASTPAAYFDSLGFASQSFSLRSYYGEVSYGQVDIVTVDMPSSTGWQRAPETYAYYVGGNYGWGAYPGNSQGLVEDVCDLADTAVDFAEYDNDGDGYVDGVNVVYAGTFDGTPETIWPHAWSLPSPAPHDGVLVSSFSVQNEYGGAPGDQSANVLCHEFGHVLGLPDLYDYGYDSYGVGDWCLMGFGVYNGGGWSPAHLCAWNRILLGVAEAVNVTAAGWYDLPAVEESGTIYRLWSDGQQGQQYFLAENRRPFGFDSALPAHGVLFWHIDESVTTGNENQWYPGYTGNGHFLVAIEQADGLWDIEQMHNYGDGGDPWPGSSGKSEFSYWSVPDTRDYMFQATGVLASGIPASADTVSVFFDVGDQGTGGGGPDPGLTLLVRNPAAGSLELRLPAACDGAAHARLADLAGRIVLSEGPLPVGAGGTARIDVSRLPEGVYVLSVEADGWSARSPVTLLRR